MVQKELYNVREHRKKEEGRRSPFALCSIESDRSSHPQTMSSSPRIMSPPNSMFLVPIPSSLTPMLTVVKLIEA